MGVGRQVLRATRTYLEIRELVLRLIFINLNRINFAEPNVGSSCCFLTKCSKTIKMIYNF